MGFLLFISYGLFLGGIWYSGMLTYKLNLKTDVANALVESVTQETVTSTNTSAQQPNVEDRISKLEENQNTKKDDQNAT
jgi:hypothetical protein